MGKKEKKDTKPPPTDVFDALLVESHQAATVVLMLDSPEEDVQSKACEAIYKFVDKCDDNKKTLLDLDVMDRLLRLIQSEDRIVRRNASMAFGVMAAHADVRRLLRKREECVPAVIALLAPEEDGVCHEFGALCLSYLSNDFSSKVTIYEQDGLDPLIRCLTSSDPDVQKNAIETISHMLQDYQARTALRELDGLKPVVDLLKSEYAIIQHLAFTALDRATQDADNRAAMREMEGLDTLIRFIGTPEYGDLHTFAVVVLSNCLEDVESMEMIKESGGLQRLVAFITDIKPPDEEPKKEGKKGGSRKGKKSKDDDDDKHKSKSSAEELVPTLPEVKLYAAKAIARAAKNADNRKILHETEVEKMLILLLGHDDPNVQTAAAQAVAVMSENLTSRDSIGQWEGIEPLVKMLKTDHDDSREGASLALANLTASNAHNCHEVVNYGGIEPLINLLSDVKELTVANSAVVLTNMSTDEVMRSQIQQAGVIYALIEPLRSSNSTVQAKAALAAAAFVCDANTRAEFRNSGGLEPLIKLLTSGNDEARRSASWAITVCAVDEPTAMELCRLGGIEILQEIALSTTRRNAFTEAALDKLLDNNLSAKYAMHGYLRPSNLIADGFFDPGQLKPGQQFLSLEDNCKRKVDQKRPVLLINAKADRPHSANPAMSEADVKLDGSKSSLANRPSKTGRDSNKGKSRAQREREEKQREAEMQEALQREAESREEQPFVAPCDPVLARYVEDVYDKIQPLYTTKEQVIALAQYVSDHMGGPIERGQVANFSYELPIGQIKYDLDCNVIPLGTVKTGIHYHRALLFKALADRIAVGCSLQRGEYNRAWNEVLLTDNQEGEVMFPPKKYIVDLIHEPGKLMRSDTPEAVQYQRL